MAEALVNFSDWLGNKLKELNTDESVFGSYISGILDSDETADEKNEALQGILSEIVENENNLNDLCAEILDMWCKLQTKESASSVKDPLEDVDVKLAKLMESQCLQTTKQKQYTDEERKIREAILAQYSQMTDDEEEEDDVCVSPEAGMQKNMNAQNVAQAEKEKRENAKQESQKKKEKDKEDRQKQKQLQEDKKEKRKTQKGERRR
ncbi:PREDICTED: coiled-coil domain-containing protein 43 [Nicrophorus vespilloides]|uniref:Coiled-coil domain-containing protein 43 n=1 Tax=Nicrophorus vespilloides TaxID=110193 RepID=A0ABM1ND92_NICVS|nr:PREDICTED: coiled-coil domain-containing protein 43 [Nicrophorus vespilloides]